VHAELWLDARTTNNQTINAEAFDATGDYGVENGSDVTYGSVSFVAPVTGFSTLSSCVVC